MADQSFGVKQLNLLGSGVPTIQSPSDLNLNANNVAISTNLTVGNKVSVLSTGIVTSVSGVVTYYGDGSNLTGVSGGIAGINTTGKSYFKDVDVSGNLKVTGVSTLGVTTFTGNVSIGSSLLFGDNNKAIFGGPSVGPGDGPLQIYHSGSDGIIKATDDLWITGTDNIFLADAGNNDEKWLRTAANSGVYLFFNGTQRFGTTGVGVTVYGNTETQTLNVTGVTTAGIITGATYYGDGSNLTGVGGGAAGLWQQTQAGINTSSSVGIGTTNPEHKLHVNVGTSTAAVSIEGSAGQLFSVTNNLTTGSIFSVNDVSGIPSIDVNADGNVQLAPFSGDKVGVGITNPATKFGVKGSLSERINIVANKISAASNINIDDGMIHYFTTQETTTSTPNIKSTNGINSDLAVGDSITVVIINTAASAGYSAQMTIEGSAQTEKWLGASAPSTGSAQGHDVYTYNIIKTASNTYTVLANMTNFA